MKVLIAILTAFVLTHNVFASGYGGYDQEPVEVTPVEVTVTGVAMPTCDESKKTVKFSFNNTCANEYELNKSCPCIEVDGKNYCQYTTTVVCEPQYEVYY